MVSVFKMLSSKNPVTLSKQAKHEYLRNMGDAKYATSVKNPYKLVDLSNLPTLHGENKNTKVN